MRIAIIVFLTLMTNGNAHEENCKKKIEKIFYHAKKKCMKKCRHEYVSHWTICVKMEFYRDCYRRHVTDSVATIFDVGAWQDEPPKK